MQRDIISLKRPRLWCSLTGQASWLGGICSDAPEIQNLSKQAWLPSRTRQKMYSIALKISRSKALSRIIHHGRLLGRNHRVIRYV